MNTIHTHCCYCRRKLNDRSIFNPLKRTKDHFIPISRTGTNGENVLDCCHECNQWKADKMPDFWLNQVKYYSDKRKQFGSYKPMDYKQIIGSIKYWVRKGNIRLQNLKNHQDNKEDLKYLN
jgi:hypothetical protein